MNWEEETAEFLKAMGHPIRLKILELLLSEEACVKNIWGCLELPQATVSQHLAILRSKGLVTCERRGNMVRYFVSDPRVKEVLEALKGERR